MVGIYKISNLINNKVYIGQSVDIHKRWNNHRSAYQNPKAHEYNYYLYRSMRKYGIENFNFEVIEECAIDELNQREIYWIDYYDSYRNGYNSTPGGSNGPHPVKITPDILLEIDKYLKESDVDMQQIADIFKVSYEMIQGINTGRYWHREIEYPLRKCQHNRRKNYCIDCGKEIDLKATRCWECYCKTRLNESYPDKYTLLKLISQNTQADVGKMFGVGGNAVKKWCIKYGIPYKRKDAVQYIIDNNIVFD